MKTRPDSYVLDSFALLAYLEDEAGAERVHAVLAQGQVGKADIAMCIINYGEVLYITERERGLPTAQHVIAMIDQLPITVVDADRALTFAAAHVKASGRLSYADAFAAALAEIREATLLTGDPEFHQVESFIAIEWLPQ